MRNGGIWQTVTVFSSAGDRARIRVLSHIINLVMLTTWVLRWRRRHGLHIHARLWTMRRVIVIIVNLVHRQTPTLHTWTVANWFRSWFSWHTCTETCRPSTCLHSGLGFPSCWIWQIIRTTVMFRTKSINNWKNLQIILAETIEKVDRFGLVEIAGAALGMAKIVKHYHDGSTVGKSRQYQSLFLEVVFDHNFKAQEKLFQTLNLIFLAPPRIRCSIPLQSRLRICPHQVCPCYAWWDHITWSNFKTCNWYLGVIQTTGHLQHCLGICNFGGDALLSLWRVGRLCLTEKPGRF